MKTALYTFSEKMKPLKKGQSLQTPIFGCLDKSLFVKHFSSFGFDKIVLSSFNDIDNKSMRTGLDIYPDACAGRITLIDSSDIFNKRGNILFFIKREVFLIVSDDTNLREGKEADALFEAAFRETLKADYSEKPFCMCVYNFFEGLIERDSEMIESYEEEMAEFENSVEKNVSDMKFNAGLLKMRKKLFILRNYYEQLYEIGMRITENVNSIFEKRDVECINAFSAHAGRLSDNVQRLRDTLIQIRQEYNSVMEYNLNKTMKFHTVLTTVFLPLNLLVGWYGMNFKMPEFELGFAYPVFAAFSAVLASGVVYILKKKKLF